MSDPTGYVALMLLREHLADPLSQCEVAAVLGVRRSTIQQARRRGTMPLAFTVEDACRELLQRTQRRRVRGALVKV